MRTWTCPRCNRDLRPDDFARDGSKVSGRKSWCRECDNDKSRRYYERNRERKLAAANARAGVLRAQKGPRLCARCAQPATSRRHWYCDQCAAAVRPRKEPEAIPKTTSKGYGTGHQKLRKRWAIRVARGEVRCARCGGLISPFELWDLGHDDFDRTKYAGPEHRACNRGTS